MPLPMDEQKCGSSNQGGERESRVHCEDVGPPEPRCQGPSSFPCASTAACCSNHSLLMVVLAPALLELDDFSPAEQPVNGPAGAGTACHQHVQGHMTQRSCTRSSCSGEQPLQQSSMPELQPCTGLCQQTAGLAAVEWQSGPGHSSRHAGHTHARQQPTCCCCAHSVHYQQPLSSPPQHSKQQQQRQQQQQQCSGHCHSWYTKRLLQLMAVLLAGLLHPQQLLPAAHAQTISCPCLNSTSATGDCPANSTLLLTSSTTMPGVSWATCMPTPRYDDRWAALLLHVCWNTSCLPSAWNSSILTTQLLSFSTGLSSLPPGQYTVTTVGAPADGANAISAAFTYATASSSNLTSVSNGSRLSVPVGGLSSLSVTWTWPSSLSTGNYAQTIIKSLSAVAAQNGTSPAASGTTQDTSCADVVSTDYKSPGSCPDGQVRVWVWNAVSGFKGQNYSYVNPANVTRCMQAPVYDPYAQQLVWNLSWWLPCYSSAVLIPPVAIMTEASEVAGIDWMPANSGMKLTARSALFGQYTSTGTPVARAYVDMGSQSGSEYNMVATLSTPSSNTFTTPEAGVRNISLGVLLSDKISKEANSSVLFILEREPYTQENVKDLRMDYQTLDWSATMVMSGEQSTLALSAYTSHLGAHGSLTPAGWLLTVPLLLRDYSVVWDCSASSLDGLLAAVAGSVGIPRALIQASACVMLQPGGAVSTLTKVALPASTAATTDTSTSSTSTTNSTNSTAASNTTSNSTARRRGLLGMAGRLLDDGLAGAWGWRRTTRRRLLALTANAGYCGDARILVNITYTYNLDASTVSQLAAGASVALSPLLTAAQSTFLAGVEYALADYSADTYCTSALAVSTQLLVKGGNVGPQDYDTTQASCQAAVAGAATALQGLAAAVGQSVRVVAGSMTCVGEFTCVDCWPYSIPQWGIVLIACAAMLVVVVLLAIRLKIVRRMQARQRVPAGQLDIERTTKAVREAQRAEAAAALADAAEPLEVDR